MIMENFSKLLKGKNCIISSGAHGLGFYIAKLFCIHGASVSICGMNPDGEKTAEELRKYNDNCIFIKCDMSVPDQAEKFADKSIRHFGKIDVLVNNVGVNITERILDINIDNFEKIHRTNLLSAVILTKKVVNNMVKNGTQGSIVHISSMNSISPSPTTASYASSKGGINSFSRVLANEVGKYGIRSNVICPGWIATSYIKSDIQKAKENGKSAFDVLEEYNGSSPLIAPARATDIANHTLFLASNMSRCITGMTLKSDGAAILQAHTDSFDEPDDAKNMRNIYYNTIEKELTGE